jgi:hypothetical protein
MYVLSSMPLNRQSIAGSLFQTLTRLSTAVGFGIATAIFEAVRDSPSRTGYYANNAAAPYAATFWFAVASAALGLVFVPFLKIGTQGHEGDEGALVKKGDAGEVAIGEKEGVVGAIGHGDKAAKDTERAI